MRHLARVLAILTLAVTLDELLGQLDPRIAHWGARKLGIYDGLHDLLHGMCPCEIELDLDPDVLYGAVAA